MKPEIIQVQGVSIIGRIKRAYTGFQLGGGQKLPEAPTLVCAPPPPRQDICYKVGFNI